MTSYDKYNREERAICAHLFRLLHENLDQKEKNPLGQFLKVLDDKIEEFDYTSIQYSNIGIYCEVAIIRDAYVNKKPHVKDFMDKLVELVIEQEKKVKHCRLYSELEEELQDIEQTHPKQIYWKAEKIKFNLTEDEKIVYKFIQGLFNAKPDIVITIDNILIVCEAKFTERFDTKQFERTKRIADIYTKLLYHDLGFTKEPTCYVIKLGANKYNPHIAWKDVLNIAKTTYPESDLTRKAILNGVGLLKEKNL